MKKISVLFGTKLFALLPYDSRLNYRLYHHLAEDMVAIVRMSMPSILSTFDDEALGLIFASTLYNACMYKVALPDKMDFRTIQSIQVNMQHGLGMIRIARKVVRVLNTEYNGFEIKIGLSIEILSVDEGSFIDLSLRKSLSSLAMKKNDGLVYRLIWTLPQIHCVTVLFKLSHKNDHSIIDDILSESGFTNLFKFERVPSRCGMYVKVIFSPLQHSHKYIRIFIDNINLFFSIYSVSRLTLPIIEE